MKYLLIDNTSLRYLIDTNGFSRYIQELDLLISSNKFDPALLIFYLKTFLI